MERASVDFATFKTMAFDRVSLSALWTILCRSVSSRTTIEANVAAFLVIARCYAYILGLPAMLSAMSGHQASLEAYVEIPHQSAQVYVNASRVVKANLTRGWSTRRCIRLLRDGCV
jgi:hypothetical protein